MFPSSRSSENPPLFEFPEYLCNSPFYSSTHNNNNHALLATTQETNEAPNPFITIENMSFYNNNNNVPFVNNGSVVLPSRIIQPTEGKKDKHSKIITARGPRDRRVRLSIDVAKRFFGLQDMLGFDKASKTLDWLLTKSKLAIEKEEAQKQMVPKVVMQQVIKSVENGDLIGQAKKSGTTARELMRAKARARARERTTRKKLDQFISNKSTTIKEDLEMDKQFCSHDEDELISHGDILFPCIYGYDLSSLGGKLEY